MMESVAQESSAVKGRAGEHVDRRRAAILGSIALVLLCVAVYVNVFSGEDTSYTTPPGTIYYTGPMKAKSGSGYGTIDGRPISEEEAKAEAKRWFADYQANRK